MLLGAVLILFSSCQKGLTYTLDDDADSLKADGTQLIRFTSFNVMGDSVVSIYNYNGKKQLLGIVTTGNDGATIYNDVMQLSRNTGGQISNIGRNTTFGALFPGGLSKQLSDAGIVAPAATTPVQVNIAVHYPAAATTFDYAVQTFELAGVSGRDSIAFTYTNKHITLASVYFTGIYNGNNVTAIQKIAETTYTYDGFDNLVGSSTKAVTAQSNTLQDAVKNAYGYASNYNPLPLAYEAFLYTDEYRCSPNICIKQTQQLLGKGNTKSVTISRSAEFNENNMPDFEIAFHSDVNKNYKGSYYYR
ncbi:hypothetical protein DXN05_07585 [Deminuibacter soli]|uniref:Uncharacterized protein n=2 Tax=Deminuibacter soli TaxID=2291815 RepID=A0A3E1NL54_9BACT|nr:hypothetical protein DXN05_07585 [Deminuibacter soli]